MSDIKHTQSCIDAHARYAAEKAAFEAKYPHYCRKCGGEGNVHGWENPDPASGHGWPFTEPCPACADNGICPRCGLENTLNEDCDSCSACGWQVDQKDFLPEGPDCTCAWEPTEEELKNREW